MTSTANDRVHSHLIGGGGLDPIRPDAIDLPVTQPIDITYLLNEVQNARK